MTLHYEFRIAKHEDPSAKPTRKLKAQQEVARIFGVAPHQVYKVVAKTQRMLAAEGFRYILTSEGVVEPGRTVRSGRAMMALKGLAGPERPSPAFVAEWGVQEAHFGHYTPSFDLAHTSRAVSTGETIS